MAQVKPGLASRLLALLVLLGTFAGQLLVRTPARAQTPSPEDERAAAGASADYIDRRLGEIDRLVRGLDTERSRVKEGIEEASRRREALTTQLEELADLLGRARSRLDDADRRLSDVEATLARKTAELRANERELGQTVDKLQARAVTVYKHGPASIIDMILGAQDPADFVRRFAFAVELAHTDNRIVRDIKRKKAALLRSWEVLDDVRDMRAGEAARVRNERDRAAAVQRSLDAKETAVKGELDAQYAKLGDIEEQKRRFLAEQKELQAESAAIAAFLRGQSSTPPTVSPKGMSWPVHGPVTSGFGWRVHPIFHEKRFHSGIDIGAASGTPIAAAASGKVIFAGEKTGYGNTLIVYHGGGIATLYGHQSAIVASYGAQVTRGQTIGRVGCTGYCTGPHLHFEVRVNGDPVDPMGWLP